MAAVDSGSSVWAQLTERSKATVVQTGTTQYQLRYDEDDSLTCLYIAGSRPEPHLYVIGPRASGKSTLLNKYIQPDRVSTCDHFARLHGSWCSAMTS